MKTRRPSPSTAKALDIWKDSTILWDAKLSKPQLIANAKKDMDRIVAAGATSKVTDEFLKFGDYQTLVLSDKLPIQSYSAKTENELSALAKRYNLEVKEER